MDSILINCFDKKQSTYQTPKAMWGLQKVSLFLLSNLSHLSLIYSYETSHLQAIFSTLP